MDLSKLTSRELYELQYEIRGELIDRVDTSKEIDDLKHLTEREKHLLKHRLFDIMDKAIVESVYIIGFKARGDFRPDSDIDIIVFLEDDVSETTMVLLTMDSEEFNKQHNIEISTMFFSESFLNYSYIPRTEKEEEPYWWVMLALTSQEGSILRDSKKSLRSYVTLNRL